MKMNFSIPVIALLGGVALGFSLAPRETPPVAPASPIKERARGQIEAAPLDGASAALRARIRELESALAAASAKTEVAEEKVEASKNPPTSLNRRERMEKWRRENPKQYARMQEGRKAHAAEVRDFVFGNQEFLASIDLSRMSEEAKATHREFLALCEKRLDLLERLNAIDDPLDNDEHRALWEERHKVEQALNEIQEHERATLLRQTAEALGFTGDGATEIVETVNQIFEATDPRPELQLFRRNRNRRDRGEGGPR